MISNLPEAVSAKRQMQQVATLWDPKKNTPLLGETNFLFAISCFSNAIIFVAAFSFAFYTSVHSNVWYVVALASCSNLF